MAHIHNKIFKLKKKKYKKQNNIHISKYNIKMCPQKQNNNSPKNMNRV